MNDESNWDADLAAFKRDLRMTADLGNNLISFADWPKFEQRAFRWADAWRGLWSALAEHPLLRRVPIWTKFCKVKVEQRRREIVGTRARAEALVWAKRITRP